MLLHKVHGYKCNVVKCAIFTNGNGVKVGKKTNTKLNIAFLCALFIPALKQRLIDYGYSRDHCCDYDQEVAAEAGNVQ